MAVTASVLKQKVTPFAAGIFRERDREMERADDPAGRRVEGTTLTASERFGPISFASVSFNMRSPGTPFARPLRVAGCLSRRRILGF